MTRHLEEAFQRTDYLVSLPNDHSQIIRIGEQQPALDAWLRDCDLASWCFITAWNPGAKQRDRRENARANVTLFLELQGDGHPAVAATSRSRSGDWPDEPGFVVLGLTREQARVYANRFGQRAVVFADSEAVAELLWAEG